MDTQEILRPDIESNCFDESRCHFWSARTHCWHRLIFTSEKHREDLLRRKCCYCGRCEYSKLTVAGHGIHAPLGEENLALIWTPWRKSSSY